MESIYGMPNWPITSDHGIPYSAFCSAAWSAVHHTQGGSMLCGHVCTENAYPQLSQHVAATHAAPSAIRHSKAHWRVFESTGGQLGLRGGELEWVGSNAGKIWDGSVIVVLYATSPLRGSVNTRSMNLSWGGTLDPRQLIRSGIPSTGLQEKGFPAMLREYGALAPGSVRLIRTPNEPTSKLSTLRSTKDGEEVDDGATVEVSVSTSVFVGSKVASGVDVPGGAGSVAGIAVGGAGGAANVAHEASTAARSASVPVIWVLCIGSPAIRKISNSHCSALHKSCTWYTRGADDSGHDLLWIAGGVPWEADPTRLSTPL